MTIFQLETFLTVVDSRNFSEAADALYISQSTVSKQINALEDELKTELFSKVGRSAVLTEAGRRFRVFALKVYADYHNMKSEICDHTEDGRERLIVCTEAGPSVYGVTDAVKCFEEAHPEYDVLMRIRHSDEIVKPSELRSAHLFVAWSEQFLSDSYITQPLLEDYTVLIAPKGHPIAKEKSVDLPMLGDTPFAMHMRNTMRPAFDACQKSGFSPNIRYDAFSTDSIMNLVSEGRAVGLVAGERALAWEGFPFETVKLNRMLRHTMSVSIPRQETSPAAFEFAEHLCKFIKNRKFKSARVLTDGRFHA